MDYVEMYISGKSIPEVSAAVGMSMSTLRLRLKEKCVLRSRAEGIRIAAKNGRIGSGLRGKNRKFSDSHRKNMSKSKLEWGQKNAVGLSKKPSGYIEITRGENKGRLEHDVIMEDHIGRKLVKGECVHHKNEIRSDNRIENLELMTKKLHSKLHAADNHKRRIRNEKGQFT